jgi:hypothetical protein
MEPQRSEARPPRWRRWLLVVLGGIATLTLALRGALPPALEWGIEYAIQRETGLRARVENVDLWLLRGAIAIEGPAIARTPGGISDPDVDPATALLSWRRLYLDLDWADLVRRRVHLQELVLDGPRLRLEQTPAGGIEMAFLEGLPEPKPEVEPTQAPSEPWPVRVDALVLSDVRADVVDPSASRAPVEFALAELSLEDLVFEDGALSLSAFWIREPRLRVAREFAQGMAGAGSGAPEEEAASPRDAPEDGLRYRVEHLELEQAGVTLLVGDRALDVAASFAADAVTLRGGAFPIRAQVDVEDGAVELEGTLGLIPLVFQGRVRWTDLPVPLAVLAANPAIVSWIRSCRAHGELEIELRTEPGPGDEPAALRARGTVSADALELANPEGDEEVVLAWKQLSIVLREALVPLAGEGGEPIRVALEKVQLVEPRVLYTSPADSLAALLEGSAASEGEVPAAEKASGEDAPLPFELHADLVEVIDGDARFVDRAVDYRGRVRDIDIVLEGLRWPAMRLASARVTARPPKGKRLSLSGSLEGRSGALELELEKLALPPLNAYSEPAGYRLSSGDVSLRTKLSANDTALDARNTIELHQLGVESLHPGDFRSAFGMPLDLTLALLRDPAGKISLSVPVRIEEGATRVGLRGALQSALRQALVGAAAAPLKMGGFALSGLGVGGAAAELLTSVPGLADLAEGQEDRLDAAVALLASRPSLGLELRGSSGPEDLPRLAEETLIERLSAGEDLPEIEGAGLLARRRVADALRARSQGEAGELEEQDQALLARYAATVDVPRAALAALARHRAETVRDALITEGVEAARLELDEAVESGNPGVLLELQSGPMMQRPAPEDTVAP